MFRNLWSDDAGIVALEYLLLATTVGLSLVVGFGNLATALNVELTELSNAILAMNQGYSYEAQSGCKGTHGGWDVTDALGSTSYGHSAPVTPLVNAGSISITSCP